MRILLILMISAASALAQSPLVRILNTSRPASKDFQIGDQFEILITGAPNQPVSVRTIRHGRTDWGPVAAHTDETGRWSTTGKFEKDDFGGWSEIWTVGGKLASPAIHFNVNAPCLAGGPALMTVSGPNTMLSCQTEGGQQSFVTPSSSDSFRTPDGRIVAGQTPTNMTPDEYHMEILQSFITGSIHAAPPSLQSSKGGLGDETADLIARLIGVNALSEDETRNVLALIRAAFEKPESIAPSARVPAKTLVFLDHLAASADHDSLKQEVAETVAYVQAR